jgi:shikimate kinase
MPESWLVIPVLVVLGVTISALLGSVFKGQVVNALAGAGLLGLPMALVALDEAAALTLSGPLPGVWELALVPGLVVVGALVGVWSGLVRGSAAERPVNQAPGSG